MSTTKMRKPIAILMAVMMMFAVSLTAFAAPANPSVTVCFTQDGVAISGWANKTIELSDSALIAAKTQYINLPGANNLYPTQGTIIDAGIVAGNRVLHIAKDIGWDSNPYYGAPGAYIGYFNGKAPVNNFEIVNGVNHAWGQGWTASYTLDGTTYYPMEYLSTIPLVEGMVITFDYSTYDEQW